jgi:uncharacterized membrane protein HdeD (DUF308 family)
MPDGSQTPQINVSKMPVGSGIAGAIFTLGSMAIFLLGIPALRYFLGATVILGGAVALIIRFRRHETTGAAWLLSATKKK